jgi:uncharacterized damage-inducible protein DinB
MFELFQSIARYNKSVSNILIGLLEKMTPEERNREFDTYHKSILGMMSHVLRSDSKWLVRFHQLKDDNFNEVVSKLEDPSNIIPLRRETDDRIIRLIESWRTRDFNENVEIEFGKGKIKKELWKLILQWFNHQTHHRGGISVLLDMQGIENDYSGMIDKI